MERLQSISSECTALKHKYDDCFNSWFSEKYLKGDSKDVCGGLLEAYSACVRAAIEKKGFKLSEVEENFLGTSKDRSSSNYGAK